VAERGGVGRVWMERRVLRVGGCGWEDVGGAWGGHEAGGACSLEDLGCGVGFKVLGVGC
jgi:hypothetical protein